MLINEAMKKMPLQYNTVRKISKQKPFGDTIGSFIQFMKKTENETIVTIAALNKHLIAKNMLPFMPIISKDIAINEHKKMWEWITHEIHSRKKCITKDKYFAEEENIFNITPAYMYMLQNMCFACQYCKQLKNDPTYATNPFLPKTSAGCPYCPLDWNTNHKNYQCENTDEESGTGLFSKWQCYTFQKPNPAMARLFANRIAHLNRTKLNLYDVACNAYVHKKNKYTIKALYEAIDEAVNVNGFNLKTLQRSINDDTFFEHITKRSKGRIRYNG